MAPTEEEEAEYKPIYQDEQTVYDYQPTSASYNEPPVDTNAAVFDQPSASATAFVQQSHTGSYGYQNDEDDKKGGEENQQ